MSNKKFQTVSLYVYIVPRCNLGGEFHPFDKDGIVFINIKKMVRRSSIVCEKILLLIFYYLQRKIAHNFVDFTHNRLRRKETY